MLIRHRVLCSSAIEYYAHLTSSIMLIRHRSIYSFAIAVYLPKPGQRVAGRKCPSQSETMIKTSVFYLQPVLSMQPVTVSVSALVILSVLRDGEQDDRYRKSGKNGHRQPAGFMPHDPGFIPRIHSIRAPLSHPSAFHPCTSFEQHISPIFIGVSPLTVWSLFIRIISNVGTVVKRLKLYNRLIVNVIENSYLCVGKKNTSNRPGKAEFGGIAKINLHGKGTKFLRNITGSSVHRV